MKNTQNHTHKHSYREWKTTPKSFFSTAESVELQHKSRGSPMPAVDTLKVFTGSLALMYPQIKLAYTHHDFAIPATLGCKERVS